jgi:transposase-like protein
MPRRKEPRIPDAVLDQLLAGADPKTVFDPNGLIDDLKKALAERVLNAEMDHHLAGEEPAIGETAMAKRGSSPTPARSSWRCRATARRASIRS